MSPSVPPIALPSEEVEQQQVPTSPMIRRRVLDISLQHPPVQHADNFQDLLAQQSLLHLEPVRGHGTGLAGVFGASSSPSFNQSAAMNPTPIMSDSISMAHMSESSASSMNPAPSLPSSRDFNRAARHVNALNQEALRAPPAMCTSIRMYAAHARARLSLFPAVGQLRASRLVNALNLEASRAPPALRPNARIRRNLSAAHARARWQLASVNYSLRAQLWNLRMELQKRDREQREQDKYVQLLEDFIIADL